MTKKLSARLQRTFQTGSTSRSGSGRSPAVYLCRNLVYARSLVSAVAEEPGNSPFGPAFVAFIEHLGFLQVVEVNDIKENLRRVHEKISAAAKKCGRAPDEITLLAVSKTFPAEVISLALSAGQRQFGENRVQEAEPKIAALRSEHPVWHLVGHLQSNKARRAVELFDMIHSVDSLKLARKLSLASIELGKTLPILIQVDLANEETKFGAGPGEVFEMVSAIQGLEGLRLDGLMIIPPFFEESEETRPYFVQLRNLRDAIERKTPGCLGRGHLSMGMSHDFEVAVEEGSTIVRIGTAIFGERSRG